MGASSVFTGDAVAWAAARELLLPEIHAVDRDAVRIWCQFYPLALADAFRGTNDRDALTRQLRIKGEHDLAAQADRSHWFLYGHRFWPIVKAAIGAWASTSTNDDAIEAATRTIADTVAAKAGVDRALTLGISFAGLATLRQIGRDAFARSGDATTRTPIPGTPDSIVAARQKDDSQGAFGFLRGQSTKFTVRFDETRRDATFPIINHQHLTTAAANDRRDYRTTTGVRSSHEGPIPCDCRSASCGTCWVGILGGAEKLTEVDSLEARRLIEFGYWPAPEAKPIIRLACKACASGNVTLVIPTWHGRIGNVPNLEGRR